jgi:hypothetical protein
MKVYSSTPDFATAGWCRTMQREQKIAKIAESAKIAKIEKSGT